MREQKQITIISVILCCVLLISFIYITNEQQVMVPVQNQISVPLLILDAGHGGEDGGTVAQDGTPEKHINLNITIQLQQLCALFGFDTLMTRTEDTDLADASLATIRARKMSDIKARLAILNANPQALYIAIHQNQYGDENCCGLQVFYSPNNDVGKLYAQSIQENTVALQQKENRRKIKAATDDIYLLYHAQLPAVLVECGFMSNRKELELLKTPAYGTQLSLCILGGVIRQCQTERIL